MFGPKVSLKEHFDALRDADHRLADERALWQQRAIEQTATTAKEYRAIANEWRGALADLSARMLTRDEYTARHDALVISIDSLSTRVTRAEGKGAGLNAAWLVAVAVISILMTITAIVIALVHG